MPSKYVTRMEFRHLKYFVAVAEEKNFTRAALRLHVAQPALSRQIRDLEEEVGTPLFLRSRKGAELTAAGKAYLGEAQNLLEKAAQSVQVAQRASRISEQQLKIGIVEPLSASGFLGELLHATKSALPTLRINAVEAFSSQQHAWVLDGTLDAGFVYRPSEDKRLASEVVLRGPHVLALPACHPLAKEKTLSLKQLSAERFIQFPRQLWPERIDTISKACERAGFKMDVAQEAGRLPTLFNLVGDALGIAILPHAGPITSCDKRVVLRLLEDFDLPAEWRIVWRTDNESPPLQQLLPIIRKVAEHFATSNPKKDCPAPGKERKTKPRRA